MDVSSKAQVEKLYTDINKKLVVGRVVNPYMIEYAPNEINYQPAITQHF